jgi:hypothetical protein
MWFSLKTDVKQSELVRHKSLKPNNWNLPIKKVVFVQNFSQKQTFNNIFPQSFQKSLQSFWKLIFKHVGFDEP